MAAPAAGSRTPGSRWASLAGVSSCTDTPCSCSPVDRTSSAAASSAVLASRMLPLACALQLVTLAARCSLFEKSVSGHGVKIRRAQ